MKNQVIAAVVMALLLALLVPSAVFAKQEAAVTLSVGSVICSVNVIDDTELFEVSVNDICWDNVRPTYILLKLVNESDVDALVIMNDSPKGQGVKYPQNFCCVAGGLLNDYKLTGQILKVQIQLLDNKNNILADTGFLTTILWGGVSEWPIGG